MRLGPHRKISNLSNYYNHISGLIMTSVNFSETLQEINQKLNGIEIVSSQVQELRNDLSAISSRIDSTVDKLHLVLRGYVTIEERLPKFAS